MSTSGRKGLLGQLDWMGNIVIGTLGRSVRENGPRGDYLNLLAIIYEGLSEVHNEIIGTFIDAGHAADITETKRIISGLGQDELRKAIRGKELCNELYVLGHRMRHELIPNIQGLKKAEKKRLFDISERLERSEAGTAMLYSEWLSDLVELCKEESEASPSSIKAAIEKARRELADQRIQFDSLTERARKMLASE